MITYYTGRSRQARRGTAIELIEPTLEGDIVYKLRDLIEDSNRLLYVMDCKGKQHARNLARGEVRQMTKSEAVTLAAAYHPARKYREPTRWLSKAKTVERPAFDLDKMVKQRRASDR